ncbi:transcription elongation factor A N-terminal and central domain-containing protein [Cyprinodon tularosa]|uniref:transcription elongation factor A N-terminal and central domain-containing protein n=1 Tax=Cyprinodon tularosa TaxID=77115 RepID=UPI0018E21531|nr:transcription elongation factor A N-terminal and central domain-containing protein [Cyprinodon tularosa]
METKEVINLALQLQKLAAEQSFRSIMTLLDDLDKANITPEQLETTDIVKVLYKLLKTCSGSSVKKKARSLLSRWKRQYSRERQEDKCLGKNTGSGNSCGVSLEPIGDSSVSRDSLPDFKQISGASKGSASERGCHNSTGVKTPSSCDSVRTKCVNLLLAALHPEPPDQDKAPELAKSIEQHLHNLHGASHLKYKASIRCKLANLRNPKNGHLRAGLLCGSLAPEAFARMSVEEMASAELRQLREEYSSQGVSERQLPQGLEGTPTKKIHCKKCGGSDCRVTQVSRGALFLPAWVRRGGPDEDAMTFVTCSRCGQQWYHSSWVCL